jgi:prepilin-type N-terminal cleavage/methylation domain-containing protein/prepilin-type processing-associated H-X9-DG protein
MQFRTRGFTLVELLVVIAIIGILVAMLLPAVNAAREAARKTACIDNIKNLGLACNSHLAAKKTFPPGKVTATDAEGAEDMTNWAIEILPYIEEGGLYDRYDHKVPNLHNNNRIVLQTILPIFNCPSDPNANTLQEPQNTSARPNYPNNPNFPPNSGTKCATGSYRAVGGEGFSGGSPDEMYWDSKKALYGGANQLRREKRGAMHICVRFNLKPEGAGKVKDGHSHTLLVGEYTADITQPGRAANWANSNFGVNLGTITVNTTAYVWHPDYELCRMNMPDPSFPQPCRRAFTSRHAGGGIINFVFCDGSVRQLTPEMDLKVAGALATIAGDESVEEPL